MRRVRCRRLGSGVPLLPLASAAHTAQRHRRRPRPQFHPSIRVIDSCAAYKRLGPTHRFEKHAAEACVFLPRSFPPSIPSGEPVPEELDYTCFVICQFLGFLEVLRRECPREKHNEVSSDARYM